MIRLGEIYEQGFYDVQPDAKKANAYYSEGLHLLFMLSNHGHPLSIAELGRAALEGLGMKQDIPFAEQCIKITKNNGYEDPEFWLWENYGISMRRISITEDMKSHFPIQIPWIDSNIFNAVIPDALVNPRTCMYFVRQKKPVVFLRAERGKAGQTLVNATTINRTVDGLSFSLVRNMKSYEKLLHEVVLSFAGVMNEKGDTNYWGWDDWDGNRERYFRFLGQQDKE